MIFTGVIHRIPVQGIVKRQLLGMVLVSKLMLISIGTQAR